LREGSPDWGEDWNIKWEQLIKKKCGTAAERPKDSKTEKARKPGRDDP